MKLQLGRVLANEKFVLEFDCKEDFSFLEMGDGEHPFGQISLSGTARSRFGGVEIKALLSAKASVPCARCLRQVDFMIEAPLECLVGAEEEDAEVRLEAGQQVDLKAAVIELLFDEYPSKVLCSPDCRGLCPVCGGNLNDGACSCESK